jgi:hypothetical protein
MSAKMIKSWMKNSDHEEKNRVSSFRGYLYKLRRSPNLLAPQWGRRWFSVEGHFLRWYRYEADLCAAGMVDLKYVKSIVKSESLGPTVFTIDCEERSLVLKCGSVPELNNWIRALHKQADIARGGNGMSLVSDFNQAPGDSSSGKYARKNSAPAFPNKSKMSSLEREIEETLKKLQELELKVDLEDPVDPNSKPVSRETARRNSARREEREEELAKMDAEDTMEDSLSNYSIEIPIRFAKNVPAAASAAQAKPSTTTTAQHKTPSRGAKDAQIDSCSSIEDISLSATRVRRHRDHVNKTANKRLDLDLLEDSPPHHRDIIAGLTHGPDSREDFIVEDYPEEDSARRRPGQYQAGSKSKQQESRSSSAQRSLGRRSEEKDEDDFSLDRRRGSSSQQWQSAASSAPRRPSQQRYDDDDDEDLSDLLVRTSKERVPGKFRPAALVQSNSGNNNKENRRVKSVESAESLEFVEEDADYGAAAYYGRHGRDPGRSKGATGRNQSTSSSSSAVRNSKQLKSAWADS